MDHDLAHMRRGYSSAPLVESDLAADPLDQFRSWLRHAARARAPEPNAMVLATVSPDGQPSTRNVLLKGIDDGCFVFFTNHRSGKAADIAANPKVSLCFSWIAVERQVVVCGTASPVSLEACRSYWETRPRESQLGAWASQQSSVVGSRAELDGAVAELEQRFPREIPLPEFWGGYQIAPHLIEFWQGGAGRLHDRLRYRYDDGGWVVERLAP